MKLHTCILILFTFLTVGCAHTPPVVQKPQNIPQHIKKNTENTQQQIQKPQDNQQIETGTYICIKEHCYDVEIADEGVERMNGLMRRESMESDKGMRFVFDAPAPHLAFWMKNTLIPLDMVWVDQNMHIVAIEHNVPPCKTQECPTYDPGSVPARYVLEINGGLAHKYGFVVGDIVQLQE